jgi:hypothetical protein
VDLFFFLGQVFLLSISLLLGLIMVTHLGPGAERRISDRPESHAQRSKARAGASLMLHINQYTVKGFRIKRVTFDGEPTIKAAKHDIESIGVELNVLGHGSHTPHAESSISHITKKGDHQLIASSSHCQPNLLLRSWLLLSTPPTWYPKSTLLAISLPTPRFLVEFRTSPKTHPSPSVLQASYSVHQDLPATLLRHEATTVSGSVPPTIWPVPIAASILTLSVRSQEIYSDQPPSLTQP